MAILMPLVAWRDPQSVRIDMPSPDLTVTTNPLGSHMSWVVDTKQLVHLQREIGSLLARRSGGAS